jgi:dienelactone hydrolase
VRNLIDDITKPDFCQSFLGFPSQVKLDVDRLIVGGHSFGGLTALETAKNDPRVKAVFTFDPWLYVRRMEIQTGNFKLTQP